MSEGYRGSHNLKKSNVAIEWTQELLQEFVSCSSDPIYFAENYMKIVNVDKGLITIPLYDYQKDIISTAKDNRFTVAECSRQSGKTTAITVLVLWYIIFHPNKTVALLANKADTAREILSRIQLAYEHLPKWLQQGVIEWNKGSFVLENGSRVLAAATSSNNIRGYAVNCVDGKSVITVKDKETGFINVLTIDELKKKIEKRLIAYNKSETKKELNRKTQTGKKSSKERKENISKGLKKHYQSNFLKNNYYDILTEDGFKSFDGILTTPNKETINVNLDGNELTCTPDHKLKINDSFIEAQNLEHTKNENLSTVYDLVNVQDTHHYITNGITSHNCLIIDEAAFIDGWDEFFTSVFPTISSGESTKLVLVSTVNGLNHFYKITSLARQEKNNYKLISVPWTRVPGRDEKWKEEILAGMNYDYQKFRQEFENEYLGSSGTLIAGWKLQELTPATILNEKFNIIQYEKPEKNRLYALIADVSRGKGLDYSAIQVIDISEMPYKQVLSFRDNMITPGDFAEMIHRIGRQYNNAAVLIEVNDIGQQVAETLYFDFEYDNMLFSESAGPSGKRITQGYKSKATDRGIRTTKTVKSVGCSMLKLLIEQNQLIINDFDTINELSTFSKKHNSFQAEPGCHDDLVMCLVLFAWLTEQQFFKGMTDINTIIKLRERSEEELENELLPFGFINDGLDDDTIQFEGDDRWMIVDQNLFFNK